MSAVIKVFLFVLMVGSITSIGYWAAFDATWWKPIVYGSVDEGRGFVLGMLHLFAILAFPFYTSFKKIG